MTKSIQKLIIKYFSDELSLKETQELITWVKKDDNITVFNEYIKLNYSIERLKSIQTNDSELWKSIEYKIEKPVQKLNYKRYAIAASIALFIGLSAVFNPFNSNTTNHKTEASVIKIGSDKATLTLNDGSSIPLEKGKKFNAKNGNIASNGEEITYTASEKEPIKLTYNYLTIPRGGEFFIQLADGTKVWLNSESQLKYPVNFRKGETRKVELVYGEAYFEVSPSHQHNGDLFAVNCKNQEIKVFGTKFNINTYKESIIKSTLIEGKISLTANGVSHVLKPNQQAIVSSEKANTTITMLKNASDEIDWMKGIFNFKDKQLKEIMLQLSRWYDVEVSYINTKTAAIKFTGTLSKNQALENILEVITKTSNLKYQIKDKQIIIQ